MAKMGRKPLPKKRLRANVLRIRLNGAERRKLDKAAHGNTSTWARGVLLREAGK